LLIHKKIHPGGYHGNGKDGLFHLVNVFGLEFYSNQSLQVFSLL